MKSRRISRKRTRKTYAGRVVYDRKPRPFRLSDIVRIAKKVNLEKSRIEDIYFYFQIIFALNIRVYALMIQKGYTDFKTMMDNLELLRLFLLGANQLWVEIGKNFLMELLYMILDYFGLRLRSKDD